MRTLPSLRRNRDGFLLMEGMLGIVLFVIFVSAVAMTFLVVQDMTANAGDTARANFLSEEALEATASIRDQSFSSLSVGTHGLSMSGGKWTWSGTETPSTGGFLTRISLSSLAPDTVRAIATTTWQQRRGGTGSVTLVQDFTDWKKTIGQAGECAALTLQGSAVEAGTPLFNRAVRRGNTLFVTSEISAGGAGLYAFDIANEAAPTRLSSGFALGVAGGDLALMGDVLVVLTGSISAELQAYDVSDPASLDASDLLTSVDLPGSGQGRSILLQAIGPSLQTSLLVGLSDDASEDQLMAYQVSTTLGAGGEVTGVTLQPAGTLHDAGGSVTGLAMVSPYLAYASNTMNTSELRAYALNDDGEGIVTLGIATGTGANATDTLDGLSLAAAGTSTLLGRAAGAAIEELLLFPLSLTGAPASGTGPWVHEIGGAVNGLAMDLPGNCAFAATENTTKELIMLSPSTLQAGGSPERAIYDSVTGDGRGVTYDATSNRVYLLTNQAIHIFRPS